VLVFAYFGLTKTWKKWFSVSVKMSFSLAKKSYTQKKIEKRKNWLQ
jgi:hypothetical protein